MSSTFSSQFDTKVRTAWHAHKTNQEFELLVACTSPFQSKAVRELRSGYIDWDRTLRLAQHHGLIPPLTAAVEKLGLEVPSSFLKKLREENLKNTRQALWLTRELCRILTQLKARNVDALPYKGPVLAELLYGNVASRQFNDIDVLIRERDLPIAVAALHELGYEPGISLTPRQERAYVLSGYEYTFDGEYGRNLVEVQWRVLPRFYSVDLATEDLFESHLTVTFSGQSIWTLCPEDLLIVLCLHAAKHGWAQLSWLADISMLAQTAPLDWESAARTASRLGISRLVALTFCLCQRLWNTPLPEVLREEKFFDPIIMQQLDLLASGAELDVESILYFRRMLQVRERHIDQLRFLWRLTTTSGYGEWSTIRLPQSLFPLYGAVRAFRLGRRLLTSL